MTNTKMHENSCQNQHVLRYYVQQTHLKDCICHLKLIADLHTCLCLRWL